MKDKFLTREEVCKVINGEGNARRVPMAIHFWSNLGRFSQKAREEFTKVYEQFPCDIHNINLVMPDVYKFEENQEKQTWVNKMKPEVIKALDSNNAIDFDVDDIDDIIANFPNPNDKFIYPENPENDGRYRLGTWFYCFFERLWSLRGMENSLCDFYEHPDEIHKMFSALTEFYKTLMTNAKQKYNLDGMFTSDDIGTQTSPFFSQEIFEEFFKPYYKQLIDHAHSLGMHFWLHTCGHILPYIKDFVEIGLDVIHPIQKYTMDEKEVAFKHGNDICIWGGFDVQQTIPYGTADDVREEVRFMMDTYVRENGRFILTAGNGFTEDTPIDSLYALLDEALNYGTQKIAEINNSK